MQHSEALVAEEAGVAGSQPVAGGEPPGEKRGFKVLICSRASTGKTQHAPSDEDVADAALLRGEPVLVCEERIQFLIQAVAPVGQPGKKK